MLKKHDQENPNDLDLSQATENQGAALILAIRNPMADRMLESGNLLVIDLRHEAVQVLATLKARHATVLQRLGVETLETNPEVLLSVGMPILNEHHEKTAIDMKLNHDSQIPLALPNHALNLLV